MRVRSSLPVFVKGSLHRVDQKTGFTRPFETTLKPGRKLPPHYEEVGGPAVDEAKDEKETPQLKRKDIMTALRAAGVSFGATAKTEDLAALLAEEQKKVAPAFSGVPSKETLGTGDQDVI